MVKRIVGSTNYHGLEFNIDYHITKEMIFSLINLKNREMLPWYKVQNRFVTKRTGIVSLRLSYIILHLYAEENCWYTRHQTTF